MKFGQIIKRVETHGHIRGDGGYEVERRKEMFLDGYLICLEIMDV